MASSAMAQWDDYQSKTGVFEISMPKEPYEDVALFQIDDERLATSAAMITDIDQRPFRNALKSYRVNVMQSIAPAFSKKTARQFIDRAMSRFEQSYFKKQGVVQEKNFNWFSTNPAGQILITYQDPQLGLQSIKKRFVMRGRSLIEQVIVGPENIMNSAEKRIFWNSLDLNEGFLPANAPIDDAWLSLTSPMQLFSLKHPDVTYPYFVDAPSVQSTNDRDVVGLTFYDPVLEENLFFNIYGYRMDEPLTYAKATKLLAEKHILRHGVNPTEVSIIRDSKGNVATLTADYEVVGPWGFSYLEVADLDMLFQNNYAVVVEFLGSKHLMQSVLKPNLQEHFSFTPKRAFETAKGR